MPPLASPEAKAEPILVDLFHDRAWQEALLGKPIIAGRHYALTPAPLIEALHANEPLHIYNAHPKDEEAIRNFLDYVRVVAKDNGGFFYNGDWVNVPSHFSYAFLDKPSVTTLTQVKVTTESPPPTVKETFISAANLYQLFADNRIQEGKIDFSQGFLDNKNYFYMTSSISKSEWCKLLQLIENHRVYKDKNYFMRFAPGTEIVGRDFIKKPARKTFAALPQFYGEEIGVSDAVVIRSPQQRREALELALANYHRPQSLPFLPFLEGLPARFWLHAPRVKLHHPLRFVLGDQIWNIIPRGKQRYQIRGTGFLQGVNSVELLSHFPHPNPLPQAGEGTLMLEYKPTFKPHYNLFITNDPQFKAHLLRQEKELISPGKVHVLRLTPNTTLSDLLLCMREDKNDELVVDEYELLQRLRKGDHLILTGDISYSLYQLLLPLLADDPYFEINGERIAFNRGQISLVLSKDHVPKSWALQAVPSEVVDFSWEDLVASFAAEDLPYLTKIKTFYDFSNVLSNPTHRTWLPCQFELLQRMVNVIARSPLSRQRERELHPQNPLKPFLNFNFLKGTPEYAFLNVLGKYLFSEPSAPQYHLRFAKVQKLCEKWQCSELRLADVKQHSWELLNCFDSHAVKALLGPDLHSAFEGNVGVPQLNDEVCQRMLVELIPEQKHEIDCPHPSPLPREGIPKHWRQLLCELEDEEPIFMQGAPGVGKSFCIDAFRKDDSKWKVHVGLDAVGAWLKGKVTASHLQHILVIDEANRFPPGTFDHLLNAEIQHEGEIYRVDPSTQKLIFMGNLENSPGCFHHPAFASLKKIIVSPPTDAFLQKAIIFPLLDRSDDRQLITAHLLWAYHQMGKTQKFHPVSIRDMKDLTARFLLLRQTMYFEDAIFAAIEGTFAGAVADTESAIAIFVCCQRKVALTCGFFT